MLHSCHGKKKRESQDFHLFAMKLYTTNEISSLTNITLSYNK